MFASQATAVAVGILRRDDGSVLLCQRARQSRYGLMWEFPGGKVESGESPQQALQRELREELSIDAEIGGLFHQQHAYYADGGMFDVHYFFVDAWIGELHNNVFNDIQWIRREELLKYDILEGNQEVCARLLVL